MYSTDLEVLVVSLDVLALEKEFCQWDEVDVNVLRQFLWSEKMLTWQKQDDLILQKLHEGLDVLLGLLEC